jgi:hypothetical protein
MPLNYFLLFISFFACRLFSQSPATKDSIFLMNGHVLATKVIDSTLGAVTINHPEKAGKRIHYEWDQLYLVKFASGRKRYYYVQDSTIGNWFTRDEMLMYMRGENDARNGFTPTGSIIGSTIAGFIGGMSGTIWGPVFPYGYMAMSGIPKVRIRAHTISNPAYVQSDAYILGYERVARQKRKLKSVVFGTAGLLAGYGFYALFHHNYPESLNMGFGGN